MKRHGAWCIWLLVMGLHVGIGVHAARGDGFTSVRDAQSAWQKATNDAARQAVKVWLEERARTCAPNQLSETLIAWRIIAVAEKDADSFVAFCAGRGQHDADPLSRHVIVLRQAELHLALQNPQAAWTQLSAYLEKSDLTAAWRAEAGRMAADVLATHLTQPQQAVHLLERTMSTITTNDAIAYADLGVCLAALQRDSLRDPAAAEATYRQVLALGQTCPAASCLAAADGLSVLLVASGRSREVPEILLQTAAHHEALPSGLARKLADCGASTNMLQDASMLLRKRLARAVMNDQMADFERLQPELIDILLAMDRAEEAVAECRVLAFCASDRGYPQAIELAARCFKILDRHLGRANRLLDFHQDAAGSAGVANPLLEISALNDSVRGDVADALARDPAPVDWMGWRRRTILQLWLDRPVQALNAARMAFAACPLSAKELQTCADGITRPVLVATRDTALVQRMTDYMLRGSAGADGAEGTADDLDDPFAEACRRLAYGKQ